MKSKRILASAALLSLVIATSTNVTSVKAAKGKVERLGGENRYETSSKVATSNWEKSDKVILASGEGYADSLSAAVLSKKLDAPIILTGSKELNKDAKVAIKKLGAKEVYVIGGNASVSKSIREGLKKDTYKLVELGGKDRFETNLAVANYLADDLKSGTSDVLVVNGKDGFSDALSVAPIAAAKGQVLLITSKDASDAKLAGEFIEKYKSKVTVVGTENVVPKEVLNVLGVSEKNRVSGGTNRFETNLNILKHFNIKSTKLYVANATGEGYADALVGSALAGKFGAPLVLTDSKESKSTENAVGFIKGYVKNNKDVGIKTLGGEGVMPNEVLEKVNNVLKEQAKIEFEKDNDKENNNSNAEDIDNKTDTSSSQNQENKEEELQNKSLAIESFDATNGRLNIKLNQKVSKIPKELVIYKDGEILDLSYLKVKLNEEDKKSLEIIVPKVESSVQGIKYVSYEAKLGNTLMTKDIIVPASEKKDQKASEIVNIPDPRLRETINYSLNEKFHKNKTKTGNDKITKAEMESLVVISSDYIPALQNDNYNKGIQSLEGIQYAKNLQFLNLSRNKIKDLSPLKYLLNIKHLYLGNNLITDLSPLSGLKDLETLELKNNHNISDIEPIAHLVNLEGLSMNSCNDERKINFQLIGNLINLKKLSINNNYISNIDFCYKLRKLETLLFSNNCVTDVNPIKDFYLASCDSSGLLLSMLSQNYKDVIEINASGNGMEYSFKNPVKGLDTDDIIEKMKERYKFEENFPTIISGQPIDDFTNKKVPYECDYIKTSYDGKKHEIKLVINPNNSGKKRSYTQTVQLNYKDYSIDIKFHITQESI